MNFHLLFLSLVFALFSGAAQLATETDVAAHGDTNATRWVAATMSILGQAFDIASNHSESLSLSDVWKLPTGLVYCNKTTDMTIDHNDVGDLAHGVYASKTSAALLRANTGDIWKITHENGGVPRGTQISYRAAWLIIQDICNFGEYDVPFSVAEYDIVDDILNTHCGDVGGWVLFIKWRIWIGRDATNDDGSFRWACNNSPQQDQ